MSYVDKLSESEKAKYEVIDWQQIINKSQDVQYSGLIIQSNKPIVISGKYHSVVFYNCFFTTDVIIKDAKIAYLDVSNCWFDNNVNFHNVTVSGPTAFIKNFIFDSLGIIQTEFRSFSLTLEECKSVYFLQVKVELLGIFGTDNVLGLFQFVDVDGNVEMIYLSTEKIVLGGGNHNASYLFEHVKASTIEVNSYRNINGFRLLGVKAISEQSKFEIKDSYLGKGEFYNVNFESFNTVTIARTHLTDCSFIDVDWNYKMNTIYDTNNDEYSSRETFRQLKFALSKQGDTVNEQKFHTLEMRAHYKSLDWDTDLWTKLIIKLSYITSNFGQSMWWPIRALFIGHSLFFLFALLTGLSSVHVSFTNPSLSAFNTAIYEYFYLINPLHRTEDLPKDWTIIIDIFMRIWSSYMIYNIIRASRRFIK